MNLGRHSMLVLALQLVHSVAVAATVADQVSSAGGVASNDRPVAPGGAQVVAASDASSVSIKVNRVVSAGASPTPDGLVPLTFTTLQPSKVSHRLDVEPEVPEEVQGTR